MRCVSVPHTSSDTSEFGWVSVITTTFWPCDGPAEESPRAVSVPATSSP